MTAPKTGYFTVVFEGNLRDFKGNPFKLDAWETVGKPYAISDGNMLEELERYREIAERNEAIQ